MEALEFVDLLNLEVKFFLRVLIVFLLIGM